MKKKIIKKVEKIIPKEDIDMCDFVEALTVVCIEDILEGYLEEYKDARKELSDMLGQTDNTFVDSLAKIILQIRFSVDDVLAWSEIMPHEYEIISILLALGIDFKEVLKKIKIE